MTLADEINEMIRFQLLNLEITSAGGDSPRINRVLNILDAKQADLESLMETQTVSSSEGAPGLSTGVKVGDVGTALRASRGDLSGVLSRFGGTGIPHIALAIAVTQLIPLIISELQRPGGFLDKRVRIDAREEAFAELDRQTRQNTRIGDRQVIVQTVSGFRSNEGAFSTNTLDLIRENANRVTDIGLFDRAQGLTLGGR
jgi:hypothetical protein